MRVGYARVSTLDQNPDLQLEKLREAGCERAFVEKASGAKTDRPELRRLMDEILRPGDTLVVWKLDRLARSLKHLLELGDNLKGRGIGLVSLTDAIDTSSPGGTLVFHVLGAIAEFERALIQERTRAGLSEARRRGRTGGRPEADVAEGCLGRARPHEAGGRDRRRGRQAVRRVAGDALPASGSHVRGGGILMAAPVQLDLFVDLAPLPADVWLRRIDLAKNMSRFYAVSVDRDLFGNLLLTRRWGRIGRAGQSRSFLVGSIAAAAEEVRRIAAAKMRRGYARKDILGLTSGKSS